MEIWCLDGRAVSRWTRRQCPNKTPTITQINAINGIQFYFFALLCSALPLSFFQILFPIASLGLSPFTIDNIFCCRRRGKEIRSFLCVCEYVCLKLIYRLAEPSYHPYAWVQENTHNLNLIRIMQACFGWQPRDVFSNSKNLVVIYIKRFDTK